MKVLNWYFAGMPKYYFKILVDVEYFSIKLSCFQFLIGSNA